MRGLIEQYELVKETQYIFEDIDSRIIGTIYKLIIGVNAQYMWTLSHYCRLEDEMDVYIPSAPFGQTLDEIEFKLGQYVERFKKAIDWKVNTSFRFSD